MNYDKIKSLEACILEAIKKHDCDPKQATEFVEQCFVDSRIRNVNENSIKRLEKYSNTLEGEIRRHKTCIDNLRGYIGYLEKENQILEDQLKEE